MTNGEKFKEVFGKDIKWSEAIEPQMLALKSAQINGIDCMEEWLNAEYKDPRWIPDNATNGDVIKAMFPSAKIEHGLYGIDGTSLICLNLGTRSDVHEMLFVEDWWNAPYNAESEGKE